MLMQESTRYRDDSASTCEYDDYSFEDIAKSAFRLSEKEKEELLAKGRAFLEKLKAELKSEKRVV